MTIATYNSMDRIIRMAMSDAGLLEDEMNPTADAQGNHAQRLLDMIQIWQIDGCKLSLIQDTLLPLTLNTNIYTFGPAGSVNMTRPVRVEGMYWQDSSGGKRDIFPVAREEWNRLPAAQNNGTVTQFMEERSNTLLRVYLWNKPGASDVAGQLRVVLRTTGPGVLNIADPITTFFPIEWAMALRWGLAADICTGQPDSIVNRCTSMAGHYKTVLEGFDVELGGIQLQPDRSGFFSRFS